MAIYLSFLVPKITAIVHATPTDARPTHSVWNHEHDRVSDFVPIASLLEWQWHRIVMRNGQFYHSSRNGASRTAQCREIPHSFPEPFYQVLQARVGAHEVTILNFYLPHGQRPVLMSSTVSGRGWP